MRLTRREYKMFIGLVAFVVVWSFFALAVKPAVGRTETLKRIIPQKQKTLDSLEAASKQYLAIQSQLAGLRHNTDTQDRFELLTFLESATRKLGLAQKVTTMKQNLSLTGSGYRESTVDVELENVTLQQLVEFIIKIKSSDHVLQIKSLYTRKGNADSDLLDSVIQISTLKPNNRI